MIIIDNIDVTNMDRAIFSARNPMNSWSKSDSFNCDNIGCRFENCPKWDNEFGGCDCSGEFIIGENDLTLMKKLVKAGTDHSKFMRMINVTIDITAPLYWWKEADTYKVGTVTNSCSTMHRLTAKEFTLDDFSHEHLLNVERLKTVIQWLNEYRTIYLNWDDTKIYHDDNGNPINKKDIWWQMIQLLPSSYNQRRTMQMNYAVLRNIYHSRKDHKLDEWKDFCKWIETLPYSELITD